MLCSSRAPHIDFNLFYREWGKVYYQRQKTYLQVVYFGALYCTFWLQPSKFFPKRNFLSFLKKKPPRTFKPQPSKILPKKAALKNILIFSPKSPLIFRKQNFLIFLKRYIQNPNIFRTLVYSNPRNIQNTLKHLRWNFLQKMAT